MQPILSESRDLSLRELTLNSVDESLKNLCLTESINKALDNLEKTLAESKARVLRLQVEPNAKIRKTLKLILLFLI